MSANAIVLCPDCEDSMEHHEKVDVASPPRFYCTGLNCNVSDDDYPGGWCYGGEEDPAPEQLLRCCERDHDGDGNCDRHSRPGVLRNLATPEPLRKLAEEWLEKELRVQRHVINREQIERLTRLLERVVRECAKNRYGYDCHMLRRFGLSPESAPEQKEE